MTSSTRRSFARGVVCKRVVVGVVVPLGISFNFVEGCGPVNDVLYFK